MSKSITIRAADSAKAMEEVVRRLGPDALILSSSRKDGQFEIVAMIEEGSEAAEELAAVAAPTSSTEEKPGKPALADRLKQALQSSPFAAEQQAGIAARKPAETPKDSPVGQTSNSTFEALLKRRLDEDGVQTDLSADAQSVQSIVNRAGVNRTVNKAEVSQAPAPEMAHADVGAAVSEAPAAAPRTEPAPQPKLSPAEMQVAATMTPDHYAPEMREQAQSGVRAAGAASLGAPKTMAATQALHNSFATPVALAPLPDDGLEYAPRVAGLGGFDIPTPVLPKQVVHAIRDDLNHFDRSGHLIGLTQAIISSLLPLRAADPLGAERFFVAGPDMRQKALAAVRIAIRKLDAGEAKPSFYVMGQEARADAAFLASKAELLGLNVMLVDETVGRNLPDTTTGAQIVILPDDAEKARSYADEFHARGDQGFYVLPSMVSREMAEKLLTPWAESEVQICMARTAYAPVSASLLACLLQFNKQVAWTSDGEEILDNLTQADEAIVSSWMRGWLPETPETPAGVPAMAAARAAAADLLGSPALRMQ